MYTYVVTVVPKGIEEVAHENRTLRRAWQAFHLFSREARAWAFDSRDLSGLEVSFFNDEQSAMFHAEELATHHPNKSVLISKTIAVALSKVNPATVSVVTEKGVVPR